MVRRAHYRRFLEPENRNVDSYVRVDVTVRDDGTDISLKMADCSETIALNFDVRGNRQSWGLTPRQALAKLEKLETALAMIRHHIEEHDG